MKLLWWAVVIYEAGVGIADLASQATDTNSSGLSTVANFPSVGSIVGGLSTSISPYAGVADLITAGLVWHFAIR